MIEFIVCVGAFTGFILLACALITLFGRALNSASWALAKKVETWLGQRG